MCLTETAKAVKSGVIKVKVNNMYSTKSDSRFKFVVSTFYSLWPLVAILDSIVFMLSDRYAWEFTDVSLVQSDQGFIAQIQLKGPFFALHICILQISV